MEDCKNKVADAIFDLDSAANAGNQNATPELVLSIIERLTGASTDFSGAFVKHLTSGDLSGDQQAEAIKHANNLTQAIVALLSNTKGVTRLAAEDKTIEGLLSTSKSSGNCAKGIFGGLQSSSLSTISQEKRPERVQQYQAELQSTLHPIISLAESLIPKDVSETVNNEDDLGDLVESELTSAARAIEEAAALLAKLLSEDKPDPKLTQTDVQVHQSILSSVKAITDAIGRLIVCATNAQQEIVANGRGNGTKTAFYKKNSRWMEGLISAAKAVATATKFLVECADGVVHGTHKMEQLVVAAHEGKLKLYGMILFIN